MKLLKSFLEYQKERFPLIILALVSCSGVIGASVILNASNGLTILLATVFTVVFLFHVRVIDEIRDFPHDSQFHPDRPIQKKIISIAQLKILRIIALVLFFGISIYFSWETFVLALVVFLYSSLAGRDFFMPHIKKYFYLYNLLNMVQLIGLQIVVYTMFNWDYHFSLIVILHLILVFLLSALLEIVRKIKLPEKETLGNDTYSAHLGYGGSLILFGFFIIFILVPVGLILYKVNQLDGFILPILIALFGVLLSYVHFERKTIKTEKLLTLVSFVYYLAINLTLYIFIK